MRGFTLIEIVIYLGLFAIVMSGLVATAYGYFESAGRNQTGVMMQEEKNFILGKINEAMSGAQTVTVSSGLLSVTKYSGAVAKICSSGTDIKVLNSSGTCSSSGSVLNNSNVNISSLTFSYLSSPEGVTASFTISAKTPNGSTVTDTGSVTRYIRK